MSYIRAKSDIMQGLVLGLQFFALFVNDLSDFFRDRLLYVLQRGQDLVGVLNTKNITSGC